MSEDIIEKVARTLAERRAGVVDDIDRGNARAAIEAMRNPTEEMDLAGVEAESYRSLGLLKVHHIWRSMIDAALKP